MFERFTEAARDAIVRAHDESRALDHDYIGNEHLLLALAADGETGGPAAAALAASGLTHDRLCALVSEVIGRGLPRHDADALASIGIDIDEVRRRVEASFGPGALDRRARERRRWGQKPFTPRAKQALELSLRAALARGDRHIGPEHVLLGVLEATAKGGGAKDVLDRAGVPAERVHEALEAVLSPAASRRARGA